MCENKIVFKGKELELNTLEGTVGPSVLDIRPLYSDLGVFTYDPGYGSTGSCESGITFIDGEQGILLHRGYPIDQLAEKSSFLEVAYLLLNGELPQKPEKEEYLQIDGKKQEYDVDRMYAKFKDDLLLIQFYVFDKILLKSAQFNVEK